MTEIFEMKNKQHALQKLAIVTYVKMNINYSATQFKNNPCKFSHCVFPISLPKNKQKEKKKKKRQPQ